VISRFSNFGFSNATWYRYIAVIGWGKDDETGGYYWIIVNSWLNWGQEGVGRIAMAGAPVHVDSP
jgi:hypothetical protein